MPRTAKAKARRRLLQSLPEYKTFARLQSKCREEAVACRLSEAQFQELQAALDAARARYTEARLRLPPPQEATQEDLETETETESESESESEGAPRSEEGDSVRKSEGAPPAPASTPHRPPGAGPLDDLLGVLARQMACIRAVRDGARLGIAEEVENFTLLQRSGLLDVASVHNKEAARILAAHYAPLIRLVGTSK